MRLFPCRGTAKQKLQALKSNNEQVLPSNDQRRILHYRDLSFQTSHAARTNLLNDIQTSGSIIKEE